MTTNVATLLMNINVAFAQEIYLVYLLLKQYLSIKSIS